MSKYETFHEGFATVDLCRYSMELMLTYLVVELLLPLATICMRFILWLQSIAFSFDLIYSCYVNSNDLYNHFEELYPYSKQWGEPLLSWNKQIASRNDQFTRWSYRIGGYYTGHQITAWKGNLLANMHFFVCKIPLWRRPLYSEVSVIVFVWVLKPFIYKICFNVFPSALINGPNLLKIEN